MDALRQKWQSHGFSKSVTMTALRATRSSSWKVYNARWQAFHDWCADRKWRAQTLPVQKVLEFLQEKADSCRLSTIKGYITAISWRHQGLLLANGKSRKLSSMKTVKTWVKGLTQIKQVSRTRVPPGAWR